MGDTFPLTRLAAEAAIPPPLGPLGGAAPNGALLRPNVGKLVVGVFNSYCQRLAAGLRRLASWARR